MNRSAQLRTLAALTMLGLARIAAAEPAAFGEPPISEFGVFEIDNGQTKTLTFGKHDRMYRICVKADEQSVPLKVMDDGVESMVYPGDCTDVEGMRISIAPGAKLAEGTALFGRYNRVKENATG